MSKNDYLILIHLANATALRTMRSRFDLLSLVRIVENAISLPRRIHLRITEMNAAKANKETPLIAAIIPATPEMDFATTVKDMQACTALNPELNLVVTLCCISDKTELAEYFVFNGGGQEQDVSRLIPAMRQAMDSFYTDAKKISDRASIVDDP